MRTSVTTVSNQSTTLVISQQRKYSVNNVSNQSTT